MHTGEHSLAFFSRIPKTGAQIILDIGLPDSLYGHDRGYLKFTSNSGYPYAGLLSPDDEYS